MIFDLETYLIQPIQGKDAWKLCDFITINSHRLNRFFPNTLKQNLTPTLSEIFVAHKLKQFALKEEFLFTLNDLEKRTIIGLIYIKELNWPSKQGELAYCIGYQYEGKGWVTKSVDIISNYAFTQLNLTSLQIIVHKSNVASVRVAEKCGYIWKRTLPKKFAPPNETSLDMELYELIA
ncbi:MAG: GNAT family N-acetyltransferase [Maribacter sp.]|nr:GNAT family N-acetyltransferase [Maribacter sp.]